MKEPALTQLADEVVRAYLELGDALRVAMLPDWIVADLTIAQLKALVLLIYHGPLAVSELARLLKVGNPAASILVQQLVDQAYVERSEDAHDRRRTLVCATAQGTELISGRHQRTEAKLRRWLSQFSEAELTGLARGLSALAGAAREEEQR